MDFDREKLKIIVPAVILIFLGLLISFALLNNNSSNGIGQGLEDISSGGNYSVNGSFNCAKVEKQTEALFQNKYKMEADCSCYLAKEKEEELAEQQFDGKEKEIVMERSDPYLITCKTKEKDYYYVVWSVNNQTKTS